MKLFAALVLLAASAANAAIIINLGPAPGSLTNLNLDAELTATTVSAEVGNTGVLGLFTGSNPIENQGTGQANIIETDDPIEGSLTFALASGYGFSLYEGNLQRGGQPPSGSTFTVLATGTSTTDTETFTLGPGENRFYVQATGELLTSVQVSVSSGADYDLFKQPRVGGVEQLVPGDPTEIPEPSSLFLLGGCLPILAYARRRASR